MIKNKNVIQKLLVRKRYTIVPNELWELKISIYAKIVWAYLSGQAEDRKYGARQIAKNINISSNSVREALNILTVNNMIKVTRPSKTSYPTYELIEPIYWQIISYDIQQDQDVDEGGVPPEDTVLYRQKVQLGTVPPEGIVDEGGVPPEGIALYPVANETVPCGGTHTISNKQEGRRPKNSSLEKEENYNNVDIQIPTCANIKTCPENLSIRNSNMQDSLLGTELASHSNSQSNETNPDILYNRIGPAWDPPDKEWESVVNPKMILIKERLKFTTVHKDVGVNYSTPSNYVYTFNRVAFGPAPSEADDINPGRLFQPWLLKDVTMPKVVKGREMLFNILLAYAKKPKSDKWSREDWEDALLREFNGFLEYVQDPYEQTEFTRRNLEARQKEENELKEQKTYYEKRAILKKGLKHDDEPDTD